MFMHFSRGVVGAALLLAVVGAQAQEEADVITWREVTVENMDEADYNTLYGYMIHHWTPERIAMIDPLFERARSERLQRENGVYVIRELARAVSRFHGSMNTSGQDWLRGVVVGWADEAPDSATAQWLRIWFLIQHAWNIRGSGTIGETSDQEYEGFQEVMTNIVDLIAEHEVVMSGDPNFYEEKITVQMATGRGLNAIQDSVAKYMELLPDDISIFGDAAYAVSPRWSGSAEYYGELARFGYELTKERFGLASYFLIAQKAHELDGVELAFSDYGFNVETYLKAVDDYQLHYKPNYDCSLSDAAKVLSFLGEREKAAIYFKRLDGEPNYYNWTDAGFQAWERWAKGEAAAPKRGQIHEEAEEGNLAYFEKAVSRGTDLNQSDAEGYTPIYIAAVNNHWELVRYLAMNGANASNSYHAPTPLSLAIEAEESETALILIDNGANPNLAWGTSGVPIYLATRYNFPQVVQALAEHADIGIDFRGYSWRATALHQAVYSGNVEIATILLDHGAGTEQSSGQGQTILGTAASSGHLPLVDLLLVRGADVNFETATGFTPLFSAAAENKFDVVERLLQEDDIDINFPTYFGDTALSVAAEHGYVGIVKAIAERPEVDPNVQNFRAGSTALHAAVTAGSTGCVRALLKAGADKSIEDDEGRTPEALALELGQERLAKLLAKE